MRKNTVKRMLLCALFAPCISQAQMITETFETYTLSASGYYQSTSGDDWQSSEATFRYDYSGGYWSGGSAYTNLADSTNGDYNHLYNCKAKKGYNGSDVYVTAQPGAVIKLNNPYRAVSGFYVTNTTYAYVSMKNGDAFAKKFGGATGNDPDWFKLLVRSYRGGTLTGDSVEVYLADFRFSNNSQDYIVKNWQWVDCRSLGEIDSLVFELKSTDVGSFGMNTPAFFSFDDFTVQSTVGIHETEQVVLGRVFPNPATDALHVQNLDAGSDLRVNIYSNTGELVQSEVYGPAAANTIHTLELNNLASGLYIAEIHNGVRSQRLKFMKH